MCRFSAQPLAGSAQLTTTANRRMAQIARVDQVERIRVKPKNFGFIGHLVRKEHCERMFLRQCKTI